MLQAFSDILNNALYVSIMVILISSLVGFYVKSRTRDRCISDLDGFLVTLEEKSGKIVWGTIKVYGSGVEWMYPSTHRDEQGHVENSYILYNDELKNVQALYRFHDDQSEEKRLARKRDIQRTYRPTIFRRAARTLRNTVNAFQDAIVQTVNTVLGSRAVQNPQSAMLSQRAELTTSGAQLLGSAARNAYDPILERYIGQYIVLEILRGETVEEEYGVLKEYTAGFIELLNVKIEVSSHLYLKGRERTNPPLIQIEQRENIVRVTNRLGRTVLVEAIQAEGESRKLDVHVESKQTVDIPLEANEAGKEISLDLSVRCLADLVVPRSLAVVRHAGRRAKLSMETLLGLDTLTQYPWVKRLLGNKHHSEPPAASS